MARKLISWLKQTASTLIDPDREQRTDELARKVERELAKDRDKFNRAAVFQRLGIEQFDVELVNEKVYRQLLGRAWKDQEVSEKEFKTLQWVAGKLGLDRQKASKINNDTGCEYFERFLAAAMDDGLIDEQEAAKLEAIARSIQTDLATLTQRYFKTQGERFLRTIFSTITEDGRLAREEWEQLLSTTRHLGMSHNQLMTVIQPQAQMFVEHVLADAKADDQLTDKEDETLRWLVDQLQLRPEFRKYIETEVEEIRFFTRIGTGWLPSIPTPNGVELRSGEVVHFTEPATYKVTRQLKSGPRVETHDGTMILTDSRLIFTSDTKPVAINHTRVTRLIPYTDGIEVTGESTRGSGYYRLGTMAKKGCAIYRTAIGRANQRIHFRDAEGQTRHIPRDVRQRVWVRYGGRCVECQSDQYLEFDHVIPVAKGGSNLDNNVHLLCRRCNLKKSDHI